MKKSVAIILSCVFLFGTTTSAFANNTNLNTFNTEEVFETMENIGFWEKENVTTVDDVTIMEYTRYDGEDSEVEYFYDNGNEVITFKSEGKENTIVVTPDGKYYWDTIAEENEIPMNTNALVMADSRVTTETWMTNTTPYDCFLLGTL